MITIDQIRTIYPESIKYFQRKNQQLMAGLGYFIIAKENGLNEMWTKDSLDELEESLKVSITLNKINIPENELLG